MAKRTVFLSIALGPIAVVCAGCKPDATTQQERLLRDRELNDTVIVKTNGDGGGEQSATRRSAIMSEASVNRQSILLDALMEDDAAKNLDWAVDQVVADRLSGDQVRSAIVGQIDCDLRLQLVRMIHQSQGLKRNVAVRILAHVCDDQECLSFAKRLLQEMPANTIETFGLCELLGRAAYYNDDEAVIDLVIPFAESDVFTHRLFACITAAWIPGKRAEELLYGTCAANWTPDARVDQIVWRTHIMAARQDADGWKASMQTGACTCQNFDTQP